MSGILSAFNKRQINQYGRMNTTQFMTPGRWLMLLGAMATGIGALIYFQTQETSQKEKTVAGIAFMLLGFGFYLGMMAFHSSFALPLICTGALAIINTFLTLDVPKDGKRADKVKGIYSAAGTFLVFSVMGLFAAMAGTWQRRGSKSIYVTLSVLGIAGAVFNFIIPSL